MEEQGQLARSRREENCPETRLGEKAGDLLLRWGSAYPSSPPECCQWKLDSHLGVLGDKDTPREPLFLEKAIDNFSHDRNGLGVVPFILE